MTIEHKNQKDIFNSLLFNEEQLDYVYSNTPLNRYKVKPEVEERDKASRLSDLKNKIEKLQNCELKSNASRLVFADGNENSKIMIIGEGPGQKEDEQGIPFVGDAGELLNKMLRAINIKRSDVYITNVVNYRPPDNRKPELSEINRYTVFLKEHISIINPKILILMGSTAMEAFFGNKIKISKQRGKWRDLLILNKTYYSIITFHPAYLLRQPEQKKFSWDDLKEIRKKINEFKIKF